MKNIIILLILFFLTGCASKNEQQQVVTIYEKQKVILANKILPVYLESVEFKIIKLGDDNYIVLSPEDYEKLLLNIETIKNYIKQQKDVIKYYESELQ